MSGAGRMWYMGYRYYPLQLSPSFRTNGGEIEVGSTFDKLSGNDVLAASLEHLLAKDAKDGKLKKESVHAIQDPEAYVDCLRTELREGTYVPRDTICVEIEGRKPGQGRTLNIPVLRDRVVERAIVETISDEVDRLQSSLSYAYRLGVGIDDAKHRVARLRDEGYEHVLRVDIHDFFPHARVSDVFQTLTESRICARTLDLIHLVASPRRSNKQRRVRSRGIAQGSCLSPLLANLILTPLDRIMGDNGFGYTRYADDIIICTHDPTELKVARDILQKELSRLELTLNEEKTMETTFDQGFYYLGADFSREQPKVDPLHDIKGKPNPNHVLYVGRDGARVGLSKERIVIHGSDGLPHVSIPRKQINRIVLTGSVGLSAGARSWALYNDIDVVCLSRRGNYLGQLAGPKSSANARRLLTQAAFAENKERCVPLAQRIVHAKIRNQLHVLNRLGRRTPNGQLPQVCSNLRTAMNDCFAAKDLDEIRGIEGSASSEYFGCLSALVPPEVSFEGRSRRPPRDLANAALSYAYAILLGECAGALFAAGLEPSLGILHSSTDKRPSLALDLMEEFRPLLVDRTVMALLRTRRLRQEHAMPSANADGVWLNPAGKKVLVDGYEATMQRQVKGALPGFAGSWRRHIHHEAQLLGRAIMEDDYEWMGVAWR